MEMVNPMGGYTLKSLKINLSTMEVSAQETDEDLLKRFLGGRGLGVQLVGKFIKAPAYSEEMPIIFATGPLTGTNTPTSGRMSVVSRSPLTGTVFDCSVGGAFATNLKRAGYDYIHITGIAPKWTALVIEDHDIRLIDASGLEGLNISAIQEEIGNRYSFAAIGIAGERLVRYASIVFDGHYLAGRGGLGAVMGSKRLKFIAVRGTGSVIVNDSAMLGEANKEIMRLLRASPAVFGEFGLSNYGTAALVDVIHSRRLEPTDNFRETFFSDSSAYSAYAIKERYGTKRAGCMGCPVLCKKVSPKGEVLPEYETLSHFGALNRCSDLEAVVRANKICNEYGIDTISAASTIACYGELRGTVVDPKGFCDLLARIATRSDNIGNALAEGSYRYAQSMGHPELSMSVKALELPAYDPRGAYGMALSYAVSNRGGCHLRAYPISHEILRKPVVTDRFSFEGKARLIKIAEDMNAIVDSLTACKFAFFSATLEEYAKALTAVTGYTHTAQDLLSIGNRICRLERYLNNLNGLDATHDDLPPRFFTEEGSSSDKIKILPINREDFLEARARYYRVRGASEQGTIGSINGD